MGLQLEAAEDVAQEEEMEVDQPEETTAGDEDNAASTDSEAYD